MKKNKLSLRDKFALKAIEIIYLRNKGIENLNYLSKQAYKLADEMMKERMQ